MDKKGDRSGVSGGRGSRGQELGFRGEGTCVLAGERERQRVPTLIQSRAGPLPGGSLQSGRVRWGLQQVEK